MLGDDRLKCGVFVSRGYCIDIKVKSQTQKWSANLMFIKPNTSHGNGGDSHSCPLFLLYTEVFNMFT